MPETKGLILEDVQQMFMSKNYRRKMDAEKTKDNI